MNNNKTNNNDNNNMITINYFIQTNPYHRLLSLLQKSDNVCLYSAHKKYKNTKKLLIVS